MPNENYSKVGVAWMKENGSISVALGEKGPDQIKFNMFPISEEYRTKEGSPHFTASMRREDAERFGLALAPRQPRPEEPAMELPNF